MNNSVFGLALAFFLLCCSPCLGDEPRLNVVLIVADDLGYGDLACYGNKSHRTPHIDALAASGVRFTDFHSAGPMCTPTRAAMLTGRYQQRFGEQFDGALSAKNRHEEGLPHAAFTIAEFLSENDYATACFGKWHLGYEPPWLPPHQGFDEFRGLASGDGDYHTRIDRSGTADWWNSNTFEKDNGYTTDLLTDYSVDFIGRKANDQRPFFLYLPHLAIHFPWQGPEDPPHRQEGVDYTHDKWGIIPDRGNVALHVKAMVEALDTSVGRIVAKLEEAGITKETLIIFTSDNGGYLTYGKDFENISSNGIFRGQKTEIYEGGHRVPMIVSLSGSIMPSVTGELGHSTDLFPTIATFTEIPMNGYEVDGVDLSSLLLRGESLKPRTLFWRMKSIRAVRQGPWKFCGAGKKTELFRLDDDPGEEAELSSKHPEKLKELISSWEQWNREVNESATVFQK